MKCALLACADASERRSIAAALEQSHHVDVVTGMDACVESFRSRRYDVTLLDLSILLAPRGSTSSAELAKAFHPFWEAFPAADIVVLAREDAVREAVRAVKAGASGYLTFPVDPSELHHVLAGLSDALQTEAELDYLPGASD